MTLEIRQTNFVVFNVLITELNICCEIAVLFETQRSSNSLHSLTRIFVRTVHTTVKPTLNITSRCHAEQIHLRV
jgi:hypothetical protein